MIREIDGGGGASRIPATATVAAAIIAAATIAPVIQLAWRAFGDDPAAAWAAILRPRTLELALNTIALVGFVAPTTCVLGILVAWAATRVHLPARRLWWVLLCLPLAIPSFVTAFAWSITWPGVRGFWPLGCVLVLATLPYVAVPTMGAFAVADRNVEDVARSLGRGPLRAFASATLPQVLPAAVSGALLVALYTISDFGAPAILRYETLTTGVYAQFTGGLNRQVAASMALVLAALALCCVAVEQTIRRGDPSRRHSGRSPSIGPIRRSPRATAFSIGLFALLGGAALAFPLGALILRMLRSDRYTSAPADLMGALATTLTLAAAAGCLAVAAALPISTLGARFRGPVITALETASYLGQALPGLVVGLALVALSLTFFPHAYQSAAVLLLAYAVLFLPKALGAERAALQRVSPRMREVSRTLGRGPLMTWARVTVPVALPGLLAGWVLVTTSVMKELPATLMLRPIGLDTLATVMWSKTSIGAYGAAAPAGLLLCLAGAVPALLLARTLSRSLGARTGTPRR